MVRNIDLAVTFVTALKEYADTHNETIEKEYKEILSMIKHLMEIQNNYLALSEPQKFNYRIDRNIYLLECCKEIWNINKIAHIFSIDCTLSLRFSERGNRVNKMFLLIRDYLQIATSNEVRHLLDLSEV